MVKKRFFWFISSSVGYLALVGPSGNIAWHILPWAVIIPEEYLYWGIIPQPAEWREYTRASDEADHILLRKGTWRVPDNG